MRCRVTKRALGRTFAGLTGVWCLGWVVVIPGAAAQEAEVAAEPAPRAEVTLDIEALLTDDRVIDGRIEDPVWELPNKPGQAVVMLPLNVSPPRRGTATLSRPEVKLAGARFIGWWIPPYEPQTPGVSTRTTRRVTRQVVDPGREPETAQRFQTGDSRWAGFLGQPQEIELDPGEPATTRQVQEIQTIEEVPVDQPAPSGPRNEGAPRLARSIEVRSNGTIAWSMDRLPGLQNGSGDSPYLLKLDSSRLRELAPARPERLSRNQGEDARAFNERRRAADNEYRAANDAYRALQSLVRALPDRFEEPMPARVWVIFERPEGRPTYAFSGPAPLPWDLPTESFEQMRSFAGRTGGGSGQDSFTQEELAAVLSFQHALRSEHPLTVRTIAAVLGNSGLLDRMQPGDPVATLAETVLAAGDDEATRVLSEGLASVVPPTRGTTALLTKAAQTGNPFAKLAALRATLLTESNRPGGVARVVQQAEAILSDPAGPDPAQVLASLIETAGDSPEARQALMAGVRFDGLPADRFDRAVAYVIRNAADPEGLPAAWLDVRLLGSPSPATSRRTLELLARSGSGSNTVAPFAEALRRMMFAPTRTPDTSAGPPLDLTVTEGIALTSTSHGLFKTLQSGDRETRRLGWDAVRLFVIPTQRHFNSDGSTGDDDPLDAILRAATSQPTTPPSLVDFLTRQEDRERATAALVRLAAEGDPKLADRAVARLRGSQRPIDQALREADPAVRMGFAEALYRAAQGDTPPFTKLAKDERVGPWLGRQVAENDALPAPAAWVEGAGGESQVMTLAADADDDLAHGALAALAAAAGGDTLDQFAVIDALGTAPREADAIQENWPTQKLSIRIGKLADAAGDYRLILEVREATPGDFAEGGGAFDPSAAFGARDLPEVTAPDPDAEPVAITPRRIVLGIVQLGVEGDAVKLAGDPVTLSIPDEALALRIADPVQLNNFPSDDVQELPLERAAAPLDLAPQTNGVWRGKTPLGARHMLLITMEPAG